MSNFLVGRGLNDAAYDVFSGTGAQTVFSLTSASSTSAATVSISGVVQRPVTDYSVAGTTLTFVAAPPSGTNNILVQYNKSITIGAPNDGTVTAAKIATGAVETAKIADGAVTAAKIETAPALAVTNFTGTLPALDGSALTGIASGPTSGTATATTSGAAVDYTSIPSGVTRIDVIFNEVSRTVANSFAIQIGSSSGLETTGYGSEEMEMAETTSGGVSTSAFTVTNGNAGRNCTGIWTMRLVDSATNTWIGMGVTMNPTANAISGCAGYKSLTGELDRVRITALSDAGTFDNGSVNIIYD